MATFNLVAPYAMPRASGGGFLDSLIQGIGQNIDERQQAAAYEPLVNAVYGGQSAPQGGGFLSSLLGGGAANSAAMPAAMPAGGAPTTEAAPQGAQQIDRGAILSMLRNPATRDQAVAILGNGGRLPQPKSTLPSDLQEYQFAQSQGFKGSFLDYQTALKRAGASSTSVTVNPAAGENAFQKTFGEGQAKRYNDMIEQGDQANSMIGDINALRDIGSRIETGGGAQMKLALGPYARMVGIDIKDLSDLEAYQAIVSRLAPQMRIPGSGANSDYEGQQFLMSLPSISKTPEGNKIVQDTLMGIAQNKRAAGQIARQAGMGEISRQEADRQLQALPDLSLIHI